MTSCCFGDLLVERSRRPRLLLTLGQFFFRYKIICCRIQVNVAEEADGGSCYTGHLGMELVDHNVSCTVTTCTRRSFGVMEKMKMLSQ